MKKIFTVLFTISVMTGYAQTEPKGKKVLATPDKCVCIELIKLAQSTPELQDPVSQDSDSIWAKYWECPELGTDFTISHLTSNCLTAYDTEANRPIDSIVFIESWTAADELHLDELMVADDIYISDQCFQDLGCGGTGTGIQQMVLTSVQVYPLPADESVTMTVEDSEILEFVARDMKGTLIDLSIQYDGSEARINTSTLLNGIYFCTFRSERTMYTTRIVVLHQ